MKKVCYKALGQAVLHYHMLTNVSVLALAYVWQGSALQISNLVIHKNIQNNRLSPYSDLANAHCIIRVQMHTA